MPKPMPGTTPGRALAQHYYADVVAPLLERAGVPHAAARLGTGSEVLGYDDEVSRDHDWGLRLQVFVADSDVAAVEELFDERLPATYAGMPVSFPFSHDPVVRRRTEVTGVAGFARDRLGLDPSTAWTTDDWLSLTGQGVLEVTAGPVFADTSGELTALRERLAWYPDDLWRYVVACDWRRLEQELPLAGRAACVGDELGSLVIAGRLAGVAMHLALLLERRWAPYSKWLGSAFAAIPGIEPVRAELVAGVRSDASRTAGTTEGWRAREAHLAAALELLLARQRAAGLPAGHRAAERFHDRDLLGVTDVAGRVAASIVDPPLRARPLTGSAEQRSDNVDVLVRP